MKAGERAFGEGFFYYTIPTRCLSSVGRRGRSR